MFSNLKNGELDLGKLVHIIVVTIAIAMVLLFGAVIGRFTYFYLVKGVGDFSSCYRLDNFSTSIQVSDTLQGTKIFCQDEDRMAKEVYCRLLMAGAEIGSEDNFDYEVYEYQGVVKIQSKTYRGNLSGVDFYDLKIVLEMPTDLTPFQLNRKITIFIKEI